MTEYHALAPKDATSLSVCASSFSAAGVRINGVPGSLLSLPLLPTDTSLTLAATLHAHADGAELARVSVALLRSGAAAQGETVMISKHVPVVAETHGHSHDGVPCTHDHGHAAVAAPTPAHGHSHDGVACTHDHGHSPAAPVAAPAHGRSHASPLAAPAHGHSHGGVACEHDHGHAHTSHAAAADDVMTAMPGGYSFSQDADSVMVELPVAVGVKASDVKCLFATVSISVVVQGMPLLSGALAGRCARDECSWSLVQEGAQRLLVLNLAKEGGARAMRWQTLLA